MTATVTVTGRKVHLFDGYTPAGRKVRAWCHCGWMTTPRTTLARAFEALMVEHGYTDARCARCGSDRDSGWKRAPDMHGDFTVVRDGGAELLVCRTDTEECCRLSSVPSR